MTSGRMEFDPTNGKCWYDPYAIEKEWFWTGWEDAEKGKPMATNIVGDVERSAYQDGYKDCNSRIERGLPMPFERFKRNN